MSAKTWMPFYPRDYLADTQHLSQAQHGTYLLLMLTCWQKGHLPDNRDQIYLIARASDEQSRCNADAMLSEFFIQDGCKWMHKRITKEREIATEKYQKRKGASDERWKRYREAQELLQNSAETVENLTDTCNADANDNAMHNQPQPQPQPQPDNTTISTTTARKTPSSRRAAAKPGDQSPESLASLQTRREVWKLYSQAYRARYSVAPVWNAKVNTQIVQFVNKVPMAEAPAIAAFYVGVNDQFLIKRCHEFGILAKQAESFRTQWATGTAMTNTKANQMDKTASNVSTFQKLAQEQSA